MSSLVSLELICNSFKSQSYTADMEHGVQLESCLFIQNIWMYETVHMQDCMDVLVDMKLCAHPPSQCPKFTMLTCINIPEQPLSSES